MMFKVLALALAATAVVLAAPSSKIEPRLTSTLLSKGSANVLVTMREQTITILEKLYVAKFNSRNERLVTVAKSLMEFAEKSQKAAIAILTGQQNPVDYEIFWISNQIYVRNADSDLIDQLASVDNVADISEEFEVTLDPIIPGNASGPVILAEWGVEMVEAPAAWALPGGNNGNGAIVGAIDTGVHPTHAALVDNFVGTNYGWRDVTSGGTQTPRDDNGHGTHTMGTIVGGNGIGVAPGAKWMTCKALNAQGSGTNAGLISCGQFMACPTLPNGVSPDCTRAPHLVSNSWGGGAGNTFFNNVINSWHAAGIVPLFAVSGSGPNCGTIGSPADSSATVIAVGATTNVNGLASFSGKGDAAPGGRVKPDVTAPGENIRSAWNTDNDAYLTISGTSTASPHAAGVVAMLKARNPQLSYTELTTILYGTTNKNVIPTGRNCGGIDESIFPNNAFGHGVVNARAALERLIEERP